MGKFKISSATPLSKTFMAISVTTALVICHRWFYAPYVKKQRYRQAEEWANMIIEKEEREEAERINSSY